MSTSESKRQRSPANSRTPPPPAIITPSVSSGGIRARKRQRKNFHSRANESPLTFIRSHGGIPPPPGIPDSSIPSSSGFFSFSRVSTGGLVETIRKRWENLMYFSEESVACLNRDSGTQFRTAVYNIKPMMDHEQFDTMGVRKMRDFFQSVSPWEDDELTTTIVSAESATVVTSEEEIESSIDGYNISSGLVAVPRLDPTAYGERDYVFFLRDAQEPVAMISIEHTVEELLERCVFLRDPGTTWVSSPDRLHVVLGSTIDPRVSIELKNCRSVIENSSPITLRLHRLIWRRQGTLWAQWHCIDGNIDRLRADLRIASRGEKFFTGNPEDDPTRSRPFAIETLVMSVLFKPTRDEFNQLEIVTGEMQRMFEGVIAKFTSIRRISQLHDRLDKDGGEEIFHMSNRSHSVGQTFMDKIDRGWGLILTSPSVGRIAFASAVSIACIAGTVGLWRRWRV